MDPANSDANYYYGDCLIHDGNATAAAEYMQRAQYFGEEGESALRAETALRTLPEAPPIPGPGADEPPVIHRAPPAGDHLRDCAECPELTVIPAGEFTMGSPIDESGRGAEWQHRVRIERPFDMGTYPVTRSQYETFVGETHRADADACFMMSVTMSLPVETKGRNWHAPGIIQSGNDPVVCIQFEDAQAYADWLTQKTGHHYRLPSEAEFEYSARSGTTGPYWWGDGVGSGRANCAACGPRAQSAPPPPGLDQASTIPVHASDSPGATLAVVRPPGPPAPGTSPVGVYQANPFGLYDMNGNVYEWVADCYHDSYTSAPTDGSAWLDRRDCIHHEVRGGSWINGAEQLRSAYRFVIMSPNTAHNHVGFRVARDL